MSQQPGVQCDEDLPKIGQANQLIQEAIESANRIDDEAGVELDRLAAAVSNTDLDKALNEIQQSASENQLELMREALPIGEDPRTVAAWWNSLTPEQQAEFERAVPVELYDVNGIPRMSRNGWRARTVTTGSR
ncbi:MAG: hypothetical protein ACRDSR_26680 [Pseudonocardiaceae bacterium]